MLVGEIEVIVLFLPDEIDAGGRVTEESASRVRFGDWQGERPRRASPIVVNGSSGRVLVGSASVGRGQRRGKQREGSNETRLIVRRERVTVGDTSAV